MNITDLGAARFQMGFSLAFHMIFAAMGVAMPFLMFIAEGLYLKTGDEKYKRLAKTWAKATGILFAVGAVSGTGLAFEMGLLWPKFMDVAGSTLGPAFTMEGYAFFTEAIFLGLYLYGWDRLKPVAHWLCGLMVAISGAASSLLVVAAVAWMQNPMNLDVLLTDPDSMDAFGTLFKNPAWLPMAIHSTLACYVAGSFATAGVYAWSALKGQWDDMRRKAVAVAMGVGFFFALLMPVTGHVSAADVAERQPLKLAAMEALFETTDYAPFVIGGIPDMETGEVKYGIHLPGVLSFLVHNDPAGVVQGLNDFPRELWPKVPTIHYMFQLMIAAGMICIAVGAAYWWMYRKGKDTNKWLLRGLILASPMGYIGLQAGWMVSERGRQPWIIYEYMLVTDAVTPVEGVVTTMYTFVGLYSALAVVLVVLLRRLKHA